MTLRPLLLLLLAPLTVLAVSPVTFDAAGDFGTAASSPNFNFSASSSVWYAETAGVGINGTRALALLGAGSDVSFTHKGTGSAADLSTFNSTVTASIFFKKANAATASTSRVLDLALVPGANYFASQGKHCQVRLRTTGTSSVSLQFWNSNADVGTATTGTLTAGNFYRLAFRATNLDGVRLKLEAWLEDYGTTGSTLITSSLLYNMSTFVNLTMANCADVHAGFRLRNENSSNAIAVVDQLDISRTAGSGTLAARAFVHPGLLNSEAEMLYWSVLAGNGTQPQAAGLARVAAGLNDLGQTFLNHVPQAATTWTAATHWSTPGPARRLLDDARAAYACALLWRSTGNPAYSTKAAQILDVWSGTLTTILNASGQPSTNADSRQDFQLYSSYTWPAMIWTAEILRNTPGSGWSGSGRNAFDQLLVNVVRPAVEHPANELGNNWRSWRICFKISCAIYMDDTARFEQALEEFRSHAYAYITDALTGEISRDMWHSQMGIIPLVLTAEMALKQGVDLYSHKNSMLFRALEFQLPYFVSGLTYPPQVQWDGSRLWSMFEFSYHHYHNRRGLSAPQHEALFNNAGVLVMPSINSPSLNAPNTARPYRAEDFYRTGYGTLTHAGDPLDYVILAGFDLAQNPTTDLGLTLSASGGTAQQLTDPSPQHPSNGVLSLAHPSGSPVRVSRVVTLADGAEIGFDYRFGAAGQLIVTVGGQMIDTLTAPASGAGRDSLTSYRRVLKLASAGLAPGNHSVQLELNGSGATQGWIDNLIVTTPRNTAGAASYPYLVWVADHPGLSGPTALPAGDPNSDRVPNRLAYALGLDPLATSTAGLPTLSIVADRLALSFPCLSSRTDVTYTVQSSPNLFTWTDIARSTGGALFGSLGGGSFSIADPGGTNRTVTVTENPTVSGNPKRFLRLQILGP